MRPRRRPAPPRSAPAGGAGQQGFNAQDYMPPNAADQENYAPENSNRENSKPEEVNPMTTKDTLKPQINPTLNMILKRIENATLDTRTNPGHKYSPSAPLFPKTLPRKSPQGRHLVQFQHPRNLLHHQLPFPERSINDHHSTERGKTLRSTHHPKAAPEAGLRTSQDSPPDGRTHPKSERTKASERALARS